MKNKLLNLKLLYTNIPVSKFIKWLKSHVNKTYVILPLPINKIIKICALFTKLLSVKWNYLFTKIPFTHGFAS